MNKDLVFIVSPGRTGTMFFARNLPLMIDGAFAAHEPDVFHGFGDAELSRKIHDFGLYHMVLGRALGKTGTRTLATAYRRGLIDHQEAVRKVRESRERYFSRMEKQLIIEANMQWPLLLPVLRDAFPKAKIICITREKNNWIKSFQRHGGRYDKSDRVRHSRINPVMLGETSAADWDAMSQEEKLAWEWSLLTNTLEQFAATDPNSRLYTYENLFLSDDSSVRDLIAFAADHGDRKYQISFDPEFMRKRVNASS
jgi:hypothetical protein